MTDVGERVRKHFAEHPLTKEHLEEHGNELKERLSERPRRFVSEKFEELKSSAETSQLAPQSTVREFVVHAINVDIPMNSFGLHNPRGVMYVLTENREAALAASGQPLGDGFDLIDENTTAGSDVSVLQPLAIRANRGDTIEITFVNELDDRASMHVAGLSYDVETSDGMKVGYNPDTTAAPVELDSDFDGTTDPLPDEAVTYTWQADIEGTHFIVDGANQATHSNPNPPPETNFALRGLFGAVVVERPGSSWTDPKTGESLRSGVKADVHTPGFPNHREFIIFYHNAEGAKTDDGSILTYPDGTEQAVHALNYRSDPTGSRIQSREGAENSADPDTFYSSWVHGDPGGGDLVFPGYVGDPIKMVGVGASVEENHVHHFHNHRWTQAPQLPRNDDTRDSETIGLGSAVESYIVVGHGEGTTRPGLSMEEAFDVGLGQEHGGVGDILVHCHLFPHYGEGMTGFVRSHNEIHDDLVLLSSNTPEQNDRLITDSSIPTFPEFVPGEKGVRPPQPPSALGRAPEPLEEEVMGPAPTPGAPFSDPCPDPLPGTTREYTIVATGADIVYNDAGEHDPDGICFVLEEDAQAVQNGEMNPEPLVIRANVGDCVEITLRNELPGDKFSDVSVSSVSNHPHFVAFDPLGSDSTMTGYNYDESAIQGVNGDERHYRWYADEEGTIYFHDHMNGIEEGMHGAFASIVVEPINSAWRDPYNGEEIRSGTQAIIEDPNGEDFREQVLIVHDFAALRKRTSGEFVNTDREHGVNAGMMAVNFRNAPYYRRNEPDPAYIHSSAVHGDPPTPVFETYAGDPMRIRLLQGAYEEQHNLSTNGLRIDPEGLEVEDTVTQLIGASEAFTLRASELTDFERLNNFEGLPVWDHLIGSMIMDDLWSGMWGLHRVWNAEVSHLRPLPDRGAPTESLANCEKVLRRMGIPAAFDDRETAGQKARLTYDPDDDRSYPPDKDARKNAFVGSIPPKAPAPGDPCPPDTPVRKVNITAFQTDVQFNEYGDHDPYGIVFALDRYVDDIKNGSRPPEPLAIRMREGECMELTLTNALPETPDENHADPEMPNNQPWRRSNRVSLHPQRMSYDDQGSDGATIGFNFDQTIPPGESITYRWYADETLGNCVLWDMADLRGNRHHGAIGHLIVESPGAIWLDPETAEPLPSGTDAIIQNPNSDDFREYTLSMSDGRYIVNPDGTCVVPPGPPEPGEPDNNDDPCNQIGPDEDHGYVSVNNRSEPFFRRFQRGSDEPHLVYDSTVHGDPATPLAQAFVGDPVRFRVANTADKANGVAFHLAGHQFPRFVDQPNGGSVGVDDDFSTGKAKTLVPTGGAGGPLGTTGDFIYQETKQIRRLEAGFWGIFRVFEPFFGGGGASRVDSPGFASMDAPEPEQLDPVSAQERPAQGPPPIQPLPDRAGGVPIEERPGYTVTTGDSTGDGTQDVLIGVPESDIGGVEAGAAYLFVDADPSEITDLAGADAQFLGTEPGMRAGQEVRIGGPSTVDAAGGGNDITIGTDAGAETVQGGESLQNLIENPPETEIAETVQNTTESETEATIPLDEVSGGQET